MKRYVSAAALRAPLCAAVLVCGVSSAAVAQSVPSPWTARDIGAPTLTGSATHASGVFTIDGAGTDIWGSSDQFHFVYQQISGDVDLVARVDGFTAPSVWAKVGVMIRAALTANAAHGSTLATAERGVQFQSRSASGAAATSPASLSGRAPVWLRIVREGTRLTSYYSTTGSDWTGLGSSTISLGSTAYVGLVVSSNHTGSRATGVFSNVRVARAGLPSGQQSRDIGGPAIAGSATYANGSYTVRGAGADIWGTDDQFHFVYQPMTGDGEVVARVASLTRQHDWSKAGVMIRESLSASSAHAMMVTSSAKGYAFQRRPETGAYSVHTAGGTGTAPGWVRLVRRGDQFEAYRSSNGSSWTKVGADTIPMGTTVYAGLAVTSHNVSAATAAVLDSVRITASQTASNQAPAVSITTPSSGTTVTAPATVTIGAAASDPENRMASVDFYAGSTLLARDTSAPYSAAWSPTTAGTHSITAVAHDADGESSTSASVTVSVQTSTNRPPTVSLSTGGILSFTAPATISLTATASDPEGRLARVEFFNGSTRLATDTTAPYTYSWSNVPAGVYRLTAVAYDAAGASATSTDVSVTVGSVSSAPRYVVFTASSNHATSVINYVLKIFAPTANPSSATPLVTSDLGKPTPASNGDITVDRASLFSALAAGNYLLTVTAVGTAGQTQSASVTFTR